MKFPFIDQNTSPIIEKQETLLHPAIENKENMSFTNIATVLKMLYNLKDMTQLNILDFY